MVIGMPSSGKSTFIAALRHVLLSDETPTALELARPAADERHLNKLQDKWLASETFERTRQASEAWVSFHLRARGSTAGAEFVMPDLQGETFERAAEDGRLAADVHEALVGSSGLLLFTNADRPDDSNLISDVGDLDDEALKGDEEEAAAKHAVGIKQPPAVAERPFRPDLIPEEGKTVELLQVANRRPQRRRLRRICVIVSAWDVVEEVGGGRTPAEWLAQERPMLVQFLANNSDAWHLRVYGVSAQGGRLPRDRTQLQSLERASERIRVVGHQASSHDITAPIAWLLYDG